MPDNEKEQNDAGDSDDHFFPNGGAIKSSEDIHARFGGRRGMPHASDYERRSERQDRRRYHTIQALIRRLAVVE